MIEPFLERLYHQMTEEQASARLIDFLESLGADGVNIWFAAGRDYDWAVNSKFVTVPTAYQDLVYNERLFRRGAVRERVARATAPFLFGDDVVQLFGSAYDDDLVLGREIRKSVGYRNSLVVPVGVPGFRGASGVSFWVRSDFHTFQAIVRSHGHAIAAACRAAHTHIQSLRTKRPPAELLTERETECLHWQVRGMRVKEIAHKLGISVPTVRFHLANARAKLSARTSEEAVARALSVGAISL